MRWRRKRSDSGIGNIVDIPEVDMPNLSVSEKLTALPEKLKPDLDLLDIDLSDMKGPIEASIIRNIRNQMKAFFNEFMNLCKLVFYLRAIAVVIDAVRYQNQYYTDNSFDNKMVGENLKKIWKRDSLKRLTPNLQGLQQATEWINYPYL